MSRQEDFIDAGIAYRMKHGKPMCIAGSDLTDVERDLNRVFPFEAGCEHGYQYAKKRLIDILEYELDFNVLEYDDGVTTTNLIDKICKRMGE